MSVRGVAGHDALQGGAVYSRVQEEKGVLPDLILIDGGKGQLSHAVEALKAIGFYGKAPVVSLAKRMEEVFFPDDTVSVMIPKTSSALRLIQHVRDEAHRFAITFQRTQRKNNTLRTELTEIDGVGTKTVEKLLKQFGSVKQVRAASELALTEVVGPAAAKRIRAYFRAADAPES